MIIWEVTRCIFSQLETVNDFLGGTELTSPTGEKLGYVSVAYRKRGIGLTDIKRKSRRIDKPDLTPRRRRYLSNGISEKSSCISHVNVLISESVSLVEIMQLHMHPSANQMGTYANIFLSGVNPLEFNLNEVSGGSANSINHVNPAH
jgi:hypothetical protein